MKTIFKIFKRDLKKIFTNSMAVILAIGIAVLPSLYAWVNIYANWDPYGKTGNMQVAVIIEDEGYSLNGIEINVGEEIETTLKANDSIDWQFVDKETGLYGIQSGKYYAGIEIPAGFSESLTSIVTSDFVQPQITYYANEKKNAIATKITDKVVQTVQTSVNESFVTTVVNIVENLLGTLADQAIQSNLLDDITTQITSAQQIIQSTESTLNSFRYLINTSKKLSNGFSSEDFQKLLNDTGNMLDSTDNLIVVTKASVDTITSSLDETLENTSSMISSAASTVSDLSNKIFKFDASTLSAASSSLKAAHRSIATIISTLEDVNNNYSSNIKGISQVISTLTNLNSSIESQYNSMDTIVDNGRYSTKLTSIADSLNSISSSIESVRSTYNNTIKPALDSSTDNLISVLADLSNLVSVLQGDTQTIDTIVSAFNDSVNAGGDIITSLISLLDGMDNELGVLTSRISLLADSELINTVLNLTTGSEEELGDFLACPVKINTDKVYAIENYGSAMAPFYSTLAIWVGAIVLVAIMKTKVKDKKSLGGVSAVQEYFGRGLTFMFFAFIQGMIICAGDLLFLKIQCYYPGLFMLAGGVASIVYSFLVYSIVAALGDVGKAIAVILLVIQIGGSGGTFPIDVTPDFFVTVNPYLPFTFVINAMRECICGTWGYNYWYDLLQLCVYIPVGLFFGLFVRFIFKNPIKFFNNKLEDTGLF